jgi:hypothetical protein
MKIEKMECNYRNCENDLDHRRRGAKFCCRSCKTYERIYRQRHQKLIDDAKRIEQNKIDIIKMFRSTTVQE